MAKTVFGVLLESGLLAPAVSLLKGQVTVAGPEMRWMALEQASTRLRDGDTAGAKALLGVLHDRAEHIAFIEPEERTAFCSRVHRKLGQTYQAINDLVKAKALFQALLENPEFCNADLLADMGLVEAGFATLQQVRVEGDAERRAMILEALHKGKQYFRDAVERFEDGAHHAHYALAVMMYYDYMDGCAEEVTRTVALSHAEAALAGMIGSDMGEAYERMGISGQCRFIIAMLRMAALDPAQAPAAKRAWDSIDSDAGRFPKEHLKKLLEWTELVDQDIALEIAESIWRIRGAVALDLLQDCRWLADSDYLRESLLEIAREPSQPRQQRFKLWALLVPAMMRAGNVSTTEEGLDALEGLAEDDSVLASHFLEWLEDRSHYDPVWDEADAMRAKYRILIRLGRDQEAFDTLRRLFYAVRDRNPDEARQIRDLFRIRQAPQETYEDLVVPQPDDGKDSAVSRDAEARLREGQAIRVLFIGGNETQAQYDESVRQRIHNDWPGVDVTFEHTGWSSNWGREVERLKRLAAESDAVVLMSMMRTMLGRKVRAALNDPPRPWVACTGTGRKALEESIRKASTIAMRCKVGG